MLPGEIPKLPKCMLDLHSMTTVATAPAKTAPSVVPRKCSPVGLSAAEKDVIE